MKQLRIFVGIPVLVLLLAVSTFAGTNGFESGYPKPGQQQTFILVKGTAAKDQVYRYTGKVRVVFWPRGGGKRDSQLFTDMVRANDGKWGMQQVTGNWVEIEQGGLKSNVEYNVYVEVETVPVMMPGPAVWLATDPGKATAK